MAHGDSVQQPERRPTRGVTVANPAGQTVKFMGTEYRFQVWADGHLSVSQGPQDDAVFSPGQWAVAEYITPAISAPTNQGAQS